MTTTPRGIRNNNPGNIRRSATVWRGQSSQQQDPAFVQFSAMYWGVRAMAELIVNYHRLHGIQTITGLILRWAPPSENDSGAYVQAVASFSGYGASDVLSFNDPVTLRQLVRAIIQHENGEQVGFFDVVNGVRLALA
jgi:hypothetical protein